MRKSLEYFAQRVSCIMPIKNRRTLSLEQHETLAAFRVLFSEFQEHLGKTMRAVAIEKAVGAERFGSILAFMEKLGMITSAECWKLIRELRIAVNHKYEEDTECFSGFFIEKLNATPELFDYYQRILSFCDDAYGVRHKMSAAIRTSIVESKN